MDNATVLTVAGTLGLVAVRVMNQILGHPVSFRGFHMFCWHFLFFSGTTHLNKIKTKISKKNIDAINT